MGRSCSCGFGCTLTTSPVPAKQRELLAKLKSLFDCKTRTERERDEHENRIQREVVASDQCAKAMIARDVEIARVSADLLEAIRKGE